MSAGALHHPGAAPAQAERSEPGATGDTAEPLLQVRGLVTEFRLGTNVVRANDGIDLDVPRGRIVGVVGESGSGKSVLCRAILGLVPPPGRIVEGRIVFEGRDLRTLSEAEMTRIRGSQIGMIFQNPMTSLNPVWPVGDQITESLRVHHGLGRRAARDRAVELLRLVGIPSPKSRIDEYPYQWSGGMAQRAVIAMAMAGDPKLLLADEPTTALDVTIQDQILALLLDLQARSGMAIVLVSHDLGVVAETCDEIMVMYAGRAVERAPTKAIFEAPQHPYTEALLRSIPDLSGERGRLTPVRGQPPDLAHLPPGCPFHERCLYASDDCATTPVRLREVAPGHASACLYPERIGGQGG